MIEVDKTYSNDKMTEPKYKKEDYTTKFETGKMGNFKLKALKEAIKREIIREAEKMNEAPDCGPDGCPPGHKCTWNGCKLNKPTNYRGKSKENPFDTGTGPTNPTKNEAETGGKGSGTCCDDDWHSICCRKIRYGKIKKKSTSKKEAAEKLDEKELIGGKYYRKDTCRCYWSDGSSNSVMCEGDGDGCGNITEGTACEDCCNNHGMVAQNPTQHRRSPAISEAKKDKDVYDMDDELEPSKSQIKGIDKSIGDAKEALAQAIKKVKELGPDIKRLAKETNEKIKKNPAGKADYLKTYTTNPDVKAFIKLRKMLKSADLL